MEMKVIFSVDGRLATDKRPRKELVYNSTAKTVGELVAAAFEMFRPEGWLLGGFQLGATTVSLECGANICMANEVEALSGRSGELLEVLVSCGAWPTSGGSATSGGRSRPQWQPPRPRSQGLRCVGCQAVSPTVFFTPRQQKQPEKARCWSCTTLETLEGRKEDRVPNPRPAVQEASREREQVSSRKLPKADGGLGQSTKGEQQGTRPAALEVKNRYAVLETLQEEETDTVETEAMVEDEAAAKAEAEAAA